MRRLPSRHAGRFLLLAFVLGAGLLALVDRVRPRVAPPSAGAVAQAPGADVLASASPEEALRRLEAAYRLTPDRRFLLALEDVDELLGYDGSSAVVPVFDAGAWRLVSGDESVGSVSAFPDFGELIGVVRSRAASRVRDADLSHHRPAPTGAPTLPSRPLETLRELDAAAPGRPDFAAGARAYAALLLEHRDTLEASDEIAARSIATLALGELAQGRELVRTRVLVAHRLGYEREAEEMAARLDREDPLRLYVERDLEDLRVRASAGGDEATALMLADALATGGHRERFIRYVEELGAEGRTSYGILLLESQWGVPLDPDWRLLIHTFSELARGSGTELPSAPSGIGREALKEWIGWLQSGTPHGLLGLAESMLARLARQETGPLLDASTRVALHRGRIFSALERVGSDLLVRLASGPASERFAALLGEGRSTAAIDFARYFRHRIAAEQGRLSTTDLLEDLREIRTFGPAALDDLYEHIGEADFDATRLAAIEQLIARSDTRVRHRATVSHLVLTGALDLALSERLARSAIREAPRSLPHLHVRIAALDGDRATLERWLANPAFGAAQRASTLRFLEASGALDEAGVAREHERILAADPTSWPAVEAYVQHLASRGDHARARLLVETWLAREDRRGGMLELAARTALARTYYEEEAFPAAWEALAGPLEGSYGPAFTLAVHMRLAEGRTDDAEALARRRLARYPGLPSTLLLAAVHWHQERHDEAAARLKGTRPIAMNDWRWEVGPAFLRAFADADEASARDAFASLTRARFHPAALEQLCLALDDAGRPDLGFALLSGLELGGMPGLHVDTTSYGLLERDRGAAEALRWLRSRVPPSLHEPLAQVAFGARHDEILWHLVDDPGPRSRHGDYVWLVRAASYVRGRGGAEDEARRRRLDDYYDDAPGSFYDQLGRMLLGRSDPASAWAAAERPDQRVEAAYFIALRAEAEANHASAIAWYRLALSGGRHSEGESRWSHHQLWRLIDETKSIARLDAARANGRSV